MPKRFLVALFLTCSLTIPHVTLGEEHSSWKKHVIAEPGHCNTAIPLDANGDKLLDVVACSAGKVSLYMAPDWQQEIVLHQFQGRGNCIHSTALDADGDGDTDWAGTIANQHPFWLENPGTDQASTGRWIARSIDDEITGIHCLLTADIDNDGNDDLVINNFEPEKGIGDSMAWFSRPTQVHSDGGWNRHVFAKKDARGGSHYMGAADIDGDGWKEIAVGAKGKPFADGNWFAYWKHPGLREINGPWQKIVLAENQVAATNIVPADVNGDGKTDWIASRGHGVGVLWFRNPDWTVQEIDTEIEFPHSLSVGDFDLDGDIDAATCGFGSERVVWYQNDGSGSFDTHIIDHAQQSYDLKSVDMDGDGDLDLLNAGRGTGNVCWYENPTR